MRGDTRRIDEVFWNNAQPTPWIISKLIKKTVSFCKRQPLGAIGFFFIFAMVVAAIFASSLAPYNPIKIHVRDILVGPGSTYWLGTDNFGRDILSRIIYGARTSLYVGLLSVIIGTFGGMIGVISAYYGGKIDLIIQRFIDTILCFPALFLAMTLVGVLGASNTNLSITIGIVIIPNMARVVRGYTLSLKEEDFIKAAITVGCSDLRIMARHIFPNLIAPVLVVSTSWLGLAILIEAALSFLGLGTPPPTPSWGGMLSGAGRQYLEEAPWMAFFPGAAIVLAVLGVNLLGDALRDEWDPRFRGSR